MIKPLITTINTIVISASKPTVIKPLINTIDTIVISARKPTVINRLITQSTQSFNKPGPV